MLQNLLRKLRGIRKDNLHAYEVSHSLVDSEDFGLPQQRTRLYIVGILKAEKIADFSWPDGIRQ